MITRVEWAIVTKFPGDEKDYRLLASSRKQESDQNYHALIRKWLVGELPFESKIKNTGAPWYIFGIIDNPLRQMIIEQKWTDYSDRHGRPVQIMTCLLVPFDELAQSACGYRQMAELFSTQQVRSFFDGVLEKIEKKSSFDEQDLIELTLPSYEVTLGCVLESIDSIGLDRCMRLANILVTKPLGILWGDMNVPPWETRLKWLDAIMALLPYGLRASCPASSWASSGLDHKMHLYWAEKALQHHYSAWIDRKIDVDSSLEKSYFLRLEKRIAAHTDLQSLVTYLASLGDPLTFNHEHIAALLEELGRAFSVYENLNAAEKVTPDLLASALKCLENQQIKSLSYQEQARFIGLLIPSMQLSDIHHVKPNWNAEVGGLILEEMLHGFDLSSLGLKELDRLRKFAQVFFHANYLERYLEKIYEFVNGEKLERGVFFHMLVHIPQDAADIGILSEMEENEDGLIARLTSFARNLGLTEADILEWIGIISHRPGRMQEAIFKFCLETFPTPDDIDSASFFRTLKRIWSGDDALSTLTGKELDYFENRHLIAMIQSALVNKYTNLVIRRALKRLWLDQRYHHGELPGSYYNFLQLPLENFRYLGAEEYVLMDRMRITADVEVLSLIHLLQDDDENQLKEYIQQLRQVLDHFFSDSKRDYCEKFHNLLIALLPGVERTDVFLKNLSSYCQEIEALCHMPIKSHNIFISIVSHEIEKAIDASATTDEMLKVCKPLLVPELSQPFEDEHFDRLIQIFYDKHYPDTAEELWNLLRMIVGYGYQFQIDLERFISLERKIHLAVVQNKLLKDLEHEKRKYLGPLSMQIVAAIENLRFVALLGYVNHPNRSVKELEVEVHELLRRTLNDLY